MALLYHKHGEPSVYGVPLRPPIRWVNVTRHGVATREEYGRR